MGNIEILCKDGCLVSLTFDAVKIGKYSIVVQDDELGMFSIATEDVTDIYICYEV